MSLFAQNIKKIFNKERKEPIVGITSYDYITAKIVEEAKVDFILIGDSAGMVMLGDEDTYGISMEEMLIFAKAVSKGAPNTFRIGDMPFLSYQISKEQAIYNAGIFIKKGRCHAVKLEGGKEVAHLVEAIVKAGIPVMGHIGLTPQRAIELGGLKIQGRDEETAKKLLEDALALQKAGVFALVIECVPEALAKKITQSLRIPTIGIGAGRFTDGQILVFHDVVGLFPRFKPKFVKKYIDGFLLFKQAVMNYVQEVKEGKFPAKEHIFEK